MFRGVIMYKKVFALLASAGMLAPVAGALAETNDSPLSWYSDFRLRLEQDWDSQNSTGVSRDDRLRARIRLRLGLNYRPNDWLDLGVRLRSGSDDSQQSPHITIVDFDDNDTGDANFNLDKWYLKAQEGGLWAWVGRNSLPIWKPNELFWDDDATPAGFATGYETAIGDDSDVAINAGYFSLPAGMQDFCGQMGHVQAVARTTVSSATLTAAGGVFDIDGADPTDGGCNLLLQENGQRDYRIWVGNLQADVGKLSVGGDFMHNSENYSAGEPGITPLNEDETDGWDVYVTYGSPGKRGDWLLGWWYARIEQFAVNNSYSQDDWMRWGSATQTRASNFKGHELRAGYGLGNGMNLLLRVYLVDAITTIEDGNRARLDFNYRFK